MVQKETLGQEVKSLLHNEVAIGWVCVQILPQLNAQTHTWRKDKEKGRKGGMEGNQPSEPVSGNCWVKGTYTCVCRRVCVYVCV